ncbi:hypothetical protein L1987_06831 [Smallanthus sonchifolius]|uniref:Uncharacterized protein n=1 Tax=Smallanthus sonchifolius TaxID=185202 RepID=A0ACB9JZF9_9ASTR|nr:hypothetical protein L1987_06831 [Smallanthus sonchifolius]
MHTFNQHAEALAKRVLHISFIKKTYRSWAAWLWLLLEGEIWNEVVLLNMYVVISRNLICTFQKLKKKLNIYSLVVFRPVSSFQLISQFFS